MITYHLTYMFTNKFMNHFQPKYYSITFIEGSLIIQCYNQFELLKEPGIKTSRKYSDASFSVSPQNQKIFLIALLRLNIPNSDKSLIFIIVSLMDLIALVNIKKYFNSLFRVFISFYNMINSIQNYFVVLYSTYQIYHEYIHILNNKTFLFIHF